MPTPTPTPTLPDFGAANFERGAPIDNSYFPVRPDTVLSYGGETVDEATGEAATERNDVFATTETKTIEGVETAVVRDTAYANGVFVEDTLDWYSQDTEGNVWYLGEIAYNYRYDDAGTYVGTDNDGSWEAGVDGAQPGWIMSADLWLKPFKRRSPISCSAGVRPHASNCVWIAVPNS